MRFIIFLFTFLLIPLVSAETSFFDNPNEAFIMSNSATTGGAVGGTSGGTTGGGGCRYEWKCTNWSECLPSGKQTRICTNTGTCSDTYKSPETKQNCTYTAPEPKKEAKELEKENVLLDEEETKKQNKTEKDIVEKEIINRNKISVYSIIILMIISVTLYLKKDYLKKQIKK